MIWANHYYRSNKNMLDLIDTRRNVIFSTFLSVINDGIKKGDRVKAL